MTNSSFYNLIPIEKHNPCELIREQYLKKNNYAISLPAVVGKMCRSTDADRQNRLDGAYTVSTVFPLLQVVVECALSSVITDSEWHNSLSH